MIIFDLDQTLIDSYSIKHLRDSRQWKLVYSKIPTIYPFEGIDYLLSTLKGRVPLGIVTSSPRTYCSRIIEHNGWEIEIVVCYHDTKKHKPHPDPILKAIEHLDSQKERVLSVGDESKDIIASNKAGVVSIAVMWGAIDRMSLLRAKPDHYFETVKELTEYVMVYFDIT